MKTKVRSGKGRGVSSRSVCWAEPSSDSQQILGVKGTEGRPDPGPSAAQGGAVTQVLVLAKHLQILVTEGRLGGGPQLLPPPPEALGCQKLSTEANWRD